MAGKRLIVGLGNPGAKYRDTRHNVGFQVVEELARRHGLGKPRSERRALSWDGRIGGQPVKLAQPQTFMNRSGESVRALSDYYDIDRDCLLVIHDDLDTPFGAIRLRKAGGHGGQNGLRSIIQHLGGREFARLRFGIGRPPGRMNPVDYVLQAFKGDEAIEARELVARAADAVEVWLREGIEAAMSRFNGDAAAQSVRPPIDWQAQMALALRAHELSPRDPKPLAKLIALQKRTGSLDEAVSNHLKLAALYEARGDSVLANAERVKAATMQPQLVDVQLQIADYFLARDNKKKAVARYLMLADYYFQTGQLATARRTIERALAINPQHPKALRMQGALQNKTIKETIP